MTGMSGPTEPGPNTNASKVLSAAAEIEDMITELKDLVLKLRENPRDKERAYSLVYNWRTAFGQRVVSKLGSGLPVHRVSDSRKRLGPVDKHEYKPNTQKVGWPCEVCGHSRNNLVHEGEL